MLHCDYTARPGTCSMAAARSNHAASVQRSFESGEGEGAKSVVLESVQPLTTVPAQSSSSEQVEQEHILPRTSACTCEFRLYMRLDHIR